MIFAINRFLRLSSQRRSLLIKSFFLLPTIDVLLRVAGYNRARKLLLKSCLSVRPLPASQAQMVRDVAWAVLTASRRGALRATCLRRSLLIAHLLHCRGISAEIQFAARRGQKGFEAHAWVESQGKVVGDSPTIGDYFTKLSGSRSN
ncbi:lasso peptide biosynthesis B2 protein [uncultured Thiohalocapsa sp.]|uniref:lasso peptide biosynthesis B2 protein n=1 Tax=uncultured Thiohalocapsa sp. TaxID=768990 RepID=UPI00345DA935